MKVGELIERLHKLDFSKQIFIAEIGGQFPIDVIVDLPDGNYGLAQIESIESDEEE